MVIDKATVSMSPSLFESPKSIGKYCILRLFFNGKFVDSGRNLVGPSGVTWSCGEIWLSMTAIDIYWLCSVG